MVLHVVLLHADVVTDAAAEREHPLLLIHMERHVADKLSIQLRLETTHMAAGQKTERRKGRRWVEGENGSLPISIRSVSRQYQRARRGIQFFSTDRN